MLGLDQEELLTYDQDYDALEALKYVVANEMRYAGFHCSIYRLFPTCLLYQKDTWK